MHSNPQKPAILVTTKPILICTDSTVVVSLINKQGSNKSKSLTKALHSLLLHCKTHLWHLTARHIPGHLNSWADSLSRDHPIRAEWELSPRSFSQLPHHDRLQIDLFSHLGNAKLPVFGCLFNHPKASVIDSLSAIWNQWSAIYLFPPLTLIPACLRKLQTYSGVGVLIAPHLLAAPWGPALTEHCELLDLDLDVFQTVQGQDFVGTRGDVTTFSCHQFLNKIYSATFCCYHPHSGSSRIHCVAVRTLLERFSTLASRPPWLLHFQENCTPIPPPPSPQSLIKP